MKKIIFALFAVAISASSFSQTATSGFASNKTTEAGACQEAKNAASSRAEATGKEVTHYSRCECSQDKNGYWACTVNADTKKKDK